MYLGVYKGWQVIVNSRGPNTVPCGTPEMTSHCSLDMTFKTTSKEIVYPVNKLWAYFVMFKFLKKGDFIKSFTKVKK